MMHSPVEVREEAANLCAILTVATVVVSSPAEASPQNRRRNNGARVIYETLNE
jgi:hypothetical protein